jgi:hypothetical protein
MNEGGKGGHHGEEESAVDHQENQGRIEISVFVTLI